jgi:hypothetical protein
MGYLQKLSARFGDRDWVFLMEMPRNHWPFLIWGPDPSPVQGDVGTKSEDEAKDEALEIVRAHLAAARRMSDWGASRSYGGGLPSGGLRSEREFEACHSAPLPEDAISGEIAEVRP